MRKKSIVSMILAICLIFSYSTQAFAFSGVLDNFAGECNQTGLYAADSFNISDGDFYVKARITYSNRWTMDRPTELTVKAYRLVNGSWTYVTKFIFSPGVNDESYNYARFYNLPSGTYKLFFIAEEYVDLIDFDGTVYNSY